MTTVPGDRGSLGRHLAFLALTDQTNRAVRLLDKYLSGALAMTELDQRFECFTGTAVMLRVLSNQGRDTIRLRRHAGLDVECDEDHRYQVADLERWFDTASRKIAERFDQRAGTSYWAQKREAAFARVSQIKPFRRPRPAAD